MKKSRIPTYSLLIILSGFVLLIFAQEKLSSRDKTESLLIGDPAKVVMKYWESASNGIEYVDLITDTPKNFITDYDKEYLLDQKSNPKNNSNRGHVIIHLNGMTSLEKSYNHRLIFDFARNIREKKFRILEIVEQRENETNALVRIAYGNDEFPWDQENFLLVKQNDEWKIFAIMKSWRLEKTNANFAKSKIYEN